MNKVLQFIEAEREVYGKLFVDITYAVDNITPFLDDNQMKDRKYIKRVNVLKKYMELLDSAESESKKGGFLQKLKDDKYINLLNTYKNDNKDVLKQLSKCSACSCLNCSSECRFDSCLGCRSGSKIIYCDHEKINVTLHDSFSLELTNNRTGSSDRYKVLATLQDCQLDRKYIIIQNISSLEKFVLYYFPGIVEDSYGEITDPEEFDFIISTFESI